MISQITDGSRLKLLARTNCLPVNNTLCRMQIRTNPQCTICTNNYEENVNHVLLECEASLEPRKSFILIKYFWVLPVILNVLYKCKLDFVSIFGDLGYHFSNFIGDEIDKLCKKFLCNTFMLRSQIAE
jgi:hypothetical protein